MLTEGLYQPTDAEIESPTLPRPHSVHLEAVAFKSVQKRRFTGLKLSYACAVPCTHYLASGVTE